jgi:hypothetical protein
VEIVSRDIIGRARRMNIPTLIGDWFLPALQASFSGASEAQLNGPFIGP